MKVLMLSGASSIHTIRWANGLADAGIDVMLVSQHRPIEPVDPRVDLRMLPHLGGLGYFLNGPKVSRLIANYAPDVVNVHYASGYGTLGRWIKHVPYLLSVWGSDVYDFPYNSPLHRHLLVGNLKKADVIASTSHAMANQVRALCPDIEDIAITPFGVDINRFRPIPTDKSSDKLVIGTVKVLAEKYGVDTLLRAFAILRDRMTEGVRENLELELRIVGDGPQREELERLAETLGIKESTTFVGRVQHDQVPGHLAQFDIYCAFSRLDSESFGVAVIEASACGIPVVVSDAGGLPEVVLEGRTGFVVPRNSPAEAAIAMEKLAFSPDIRRQMSEAAVEHVKRKYEWGECVKLMQTLLENTV